MKTCANCSNLFPNHLNIEGKMRNISRRKYCLSCSPFKKHRTRPIGFLSSAKLGFKVCPRCKNKKPADEFYRRRNGEDLSPYCKICNGQECQERLTRFKLQAITYKGGKCIVCGYNKYYGALEFHHIDPSKKDFAISDLRKRSFDDDVKRELDKCNLLCSNCHKEIHAKLFNQQAIDDIRYFSRT